MQADNGRALAAFSKAKSTDKVSAAALYKPAFAVLGRYIKHFHLSKLVQYNKEG